LDGVARGGGGTRDEDFARPSGCTGWLVRDLQNAAEPPAEGLARSREMLEEIAEAAFPASFSDKDALLVGTGRRAPADAEKAELGELAAKLPLVLG
jgi:hypothetical protein